MSELPPGLAKRRTAVAAAAAAAQPPPRSQPAPSPSPTPTLPPKTSSALAKRDASPIRETGAAGGKKIERAKATKKGELFGIWSVRRKRYISDFRPVSNAQYSLFTMSMRYLPQMFGFQLPADPSRPKDWPAEVLELRDTFNDKVVSSLDLIKRHNLRSDPDWELASRKRKQAGTDDAPVQDSSSDDDEDAAEEDPQRAEDTLEQFAAKLRVPTARLTSEDGQWQLLFRIIARPPVPGEDTSTLPPDAKSIQLEKVNVRLARVSKSKLKKEKQALDWEVKKLSDSTKIASSIFYKQVEALANQPRQRRNRFSEAEWQYHLNLGNPDAEDEDDDDEDDGEEEEDEDEE